MAAEDAKPSLLEQARARVASRQSARCSIAKLLAARPDLADEMQALIRAAANADDEMTYDVAAEIISEAVDEKVVAQTISRHYRRKCACP